MTTKPDYLTVNTLNQRESDQLDFVIATSELELKSAYPGVFGIRKISATGMWAGCINREPKEVKKP